MNTLIRGPRRTVTPQIVQPIILLGCDVTFTSKATMTDAL
jgi:hypothetical protein